MKVIAAVIGLSCFSTLACADALSDISKREFITSKALIGQTFWIAKPQNDGLPLCDIVSNQLTHCKTIFNVEFTVKTVIPTPFGQAWLGVELQDHRKGYIISFFREHFLPAALGAERRTAILACASTAPRIGMTASQVSECWGPASQINSTATAGGQRDQLVFPRRGYVYLQDGIVTAVQTSH